MLSRVPVLRACTVRPLLARFIHHYEPKTSARDKKFKGRVPVRTGGSTKGTMVEFGKYGLRLKSEGVRLKAIQLKEADNSIMRALRPLNGKLIRRLHAGLAVCVKGNETRMGKGKGDFEYWAVRVPTGKVIFEIDGENVPESVARDVLRIAKDKLPGNYEFVTNQSLPKAGFETVQKPKQRIHYFSKLDKNPTPKYQARKDYDKPEVRQFLGR